MSHTAKASTTRSRIIACPQSDPRDGLTLLRGFLWLLSLPYGLAMRLRNFAFDAGLARSARASVRVVSVGNLSVGGTGKTPMVVALARAAQRAGRKPAILTRGYRPLGSGGSNGESDEVALFRQTLPDVPVVVDADRVRGSRSAEEQGADLLLMDDGFQHRWLRRDVDLVLLDARDPFCGGLLPCGRLREPASSLRRAHAAVLTRCGRASARQLETARQRVEIAAPDLPVFEAEHVPIELVQSVGANRLTVEPLETIRGQRILAVSGLGDPHTLGETLEQLGAVVVHRMDFGDHHEFTSADYELINRKVVECGAEHIVTTEKDFMRIGDDVRFPVPLSALRIELRLREPTSGPTLAEVVGF